MTIQSIVNKLRTLALTSTLNKRHAAAVVIGSKIITSAINSERTYNKLLTHINGQPTCCSTHAEVAALRKALYRQKQCILPCKLNRRSSRHIRQLVRKQAVR